MAMNPNIQTQFMYLFERVGEPLYYGPRGSRNTLYNVPIDTLTTKQQHAANEFRKNMASTGGTINVKPPKRIPNLSGIGAVCPKNGIFSYFLPTHRKAAAELKKTLLAETSLEDYLSMCCTCRDSEMINPKLWIYSFSSSALDRKDMKGFRIPALWEIVPDQFIPPSATRMAQRQSVLPVEDRSVIVVDRNFTGDDSSPENRVSYWREDMGANVHHWHWHLIYPIDAPAGQRDRKGELFYYMHQSMIARYDAERLSNNLSRVKRLDLDEVIPEGYFPKLYDTNSGIVWGSRQEETKLKSVDRSADPRMPFTLDLEDMKTWVHRIFEAIDTGVVIGRNGTTMPLTIEKGIDVLGDIIEATENSPNMQFYGDFHNMGHMTIAAAHDPKYHHRENLGVLGDNTVAFRDPVFHRWHKYIDEIFERYKATLPPYTNEELVWEGIQVTEISVQTPNRERNILTTHWMQSDVDLSRGLDFGRTVRNNLGPIWARVTHLNHESFSYRINVVNSGKQTVSGTVRIFMAPRNDERGSRIDVLKQRTLFFEMDKFTTDLIPGSNVIERESTESSVTVPWDQTFRELERSVELPTATQSVCSCGWPQHLLLPRGQTNGMTYDLYAILTDGTKDAVERRSAQSGAHGQGCRDAVSYCGLLDDLYPDAKPMGFPFDRVLPLNNNLPLQNIEAFVQTVPNSKTTQIRIVHRDITIVRGGGAPTDMDVMEPSTSRPSSPTNEKPQTPTPQPQPQRPTSPNQDGRPGSPSSDGKGNRSRPSSPTSAHSGPNQRRPGSRSRSPSPPGWPTVSLPRVGDRGYGWRF